MCIRQQLTRNHALYSHQNLEAAQEGGDARLVKVLETQYERDAARATEAWNGDRWKEYINP